MKSSSPDIQAILFDLDGTLIDTIGDIAYAVNTVLSEVKVEPISEHACKQFVGSGLRRTLIRALEARGVESYGESLDDFMELLMETYRAHPHDRTLVYPGVERFIEKAVAGGMMLGVLSNKEDQLVQQIVTALFPDVPFLSVHGASEANRLKPSPEMAIGFAQDAQVEREHVLLIGDSEVDYLTAQAAGMQVAIGTWGFRSRSELERHGCNPLYHTMEEIEREVFSWR